MEFLFNLLKHLSETLSTVEFIFALGIMLSISFMVVKFVLRLSNKKNIINNFLRDSTADTLAEIVTRLDKIATYENDQEAVLKIMQALSDLKIQSDQNDESMRSHISDILLLRKDVEDLSKSISKDLNELRHELKMYDTQNHQMLDGMRDILQRLNDLTQRIISQIDKIDEFARAAIPEFRSYHMELSKEVSELNRDIALVERTINTQINTSNAIKLR